MHIKRIKDLREDKDLSQEQLGKILKTPIDKWGVNYRLKKITEIGKANGKK